MTVHLLDPRKTNGIACNNRDGRRLSNISPDWQDTTCTLCKRTNTHLLLRKADGA